MSPDVIALPVWVLLALVLGCAVVFRAVRVWLAAVAVIAGLYLASTTAGQSVMTQINHAIHPGTSSTTTREHG